jgi:hypothetical protein
MKTQPLFLVFSLVFAGQAAGQAPSPTQPASPSAATPSPPPASPPKRSAAELEKLVAPIALYPDPLLATLLPASVYPLEIVQAARFVADTNNLAKLDAQPWDKSVKAVARVPDAIQKLNDDISWTIELGEAFLAQDKDILDAIQSLRSKAQKAGTLQTTPQQIVVVTNMVIEKTVEERVVVVTNTVVQIQPSSSSVVYVPAYNPYTVYYPPPAYVYNPYAPLVTFTAGVAMGAIIANNCNWYGGGCYHGDVDIDIDHNYNVNRDSTRNVNRDGTAGTRPSSTGTQKKWQPDQSRLGKSGSPTATASARNAQTRGWDSGGARPSTGASGTRPSTGAAGARPSTGAAGARPSTGAAGARPSTGTPSASRPSPSTGASRSSPSASNRSSSGSAYGGMSSGSSARSYSSRGSSSRSGGFSGGRSRGGGGGRR